MLKGSTTQNYGSVYHPGVNSDYGYADDVEEEEVYAAISAEIPPANMIYHSTDPSGQAQSSPPSSCSRTL
mgnify:CR=1 FL=1